MNQKHGVDRASQIACTGSCDGAKDGEESKVFDASIDVENGITGSRNGKILNAETKIDYTKKVW